LTAYTAREEDFENSIRMERKKEAQPMTDELKRELRFIIDGIHKYAEDTYWCGETVTVVEALEEIIERIDRRADTPEPAEGMVMVEVLEGGGIWARQMRRDGRLVQCRYNDSHEWYSVTHLHEWDAAEYRLKPAEGGE